MRNLLIGSLSLFAIVVAPHVVAAQSVGIRTAVSFVPGAVFDASETGPSVGGAMTVELSPRLALEGVATYMDRGSGADALSFQAGLAANLLNANARVVPFIAGGAGVYRASFDLGAEGFFGGTGRQFGPGVSLCSGTGVCPYGNLPAFYGRRLGAMNAPATGGGWPTRTFTDPAFHLGVGARVNLTPHVFIRPEVRGLFVTADDAVTSLGAVSVAFGYLCLAIIAARQNQN